MRVRISSRWTRKRKPTLRRFQTPIRLFPRVILTCNLLLPLIRKNGSTEKDALELIPAKIGWFAWTKGNYSQTSIPGPHGSIASPSRPGWKVLPVWVSVVQDTSVASREKVLYFDGDKKKVEAKWNALLGQARNYRFAVIKESAANPTANAVYQLFGNNSNTFIKTIVRGARLPEYKLLGPYPGNDSPIDISNIYSAPWRSGSPAAPRPSSL